MKSLKKLFALIMITFGACNLDADFYSEISDENFPSEPSHIESMVWGCYNGLQKCKNDEWAITELRTDNSRLYNRSSTDNSSREIWELDRNNISTSNMFVTRYWESTYAAIYDCNRVIANIDIVTDPVAKHRFLGEVLFLRACHYFNLVRLWGPVFKVVTPVSTEEARNMEKSTEDEVYELIEGDLEKIIDDNMLPDFYSGDNIGRVSMLAVKTLYAEVLMTHYAIASPRYSLAKEALESVIAALGNPQNVSELTPYDVVFDYRYEMNPEILFTVRYKSGSIGLGCSFANYFAPVGSGSNVVVGDGYAWNYISNNAEKSYENGDLRKEITVGTYAGLSTNNRYIKKYMSNQTVRFDGDSDWPVIRVADAILLYAEIVNELEGPTNAIPFLNLIRERAGLNALTEIELSGRMSFREALMKERRFEFAYENKRWFDLVRWGTAVDVINAYYLDENAAFYAGTAAPIEDWQLLLPIPLKAVSINPGIPQNTGY
jgi:hypothetical protein